MSPKHQNLLIVFLRYLKNSGLYCKLSKSEKYAWAHSSDLCHLQLLIWNYSHKSGMSKLLYNPFLHLKNQYIRIVIDDFFDKNHEIKRQFSDNLEKTDFLHGECNIEDYLNYLENHNEMGCFFFEAFDWFKTPQGYHYWDNINNQFRKLI